MSKGWRSPLRAAKSSTAEFRFIVKEIRFTPALDKGKAVEGTAKLRFGDIRI
jgi:hypothetical protein